jgi:lipopolysaccharide export system protein LptA
MFQRAQLCLFALIATVFWIVYWLLVRAHPEDTPLYQKLVQESSDLRSLSALERRPAIQKREGVQKDFWLPRRAERLHFQLNSKQSRLAVSQKKDKVEAVENSKEISGWVQDELGQLHNLEADQLDYDGKTLTFKGAFCLQHPMGTLSAEKASIDNLQLNHSHQTGVKVLLEQQVQLDAPTFSLKAGKAECELSSQTTFSLLDFEELHLSDSIEIHAPEHNLTACGDFAIYKLGTLVLYPSLPNTHCQVLQGDDKIDAQKIRFDLSSQTVSLEGDVRLISSKIRGQKSFAAADSILYGLAEKTLTLSSIPPRKVLFWQKDLSLSADQVIVRQDPETTVEGMGDVHFSFDLEETDYFQKFFQNYL